MESTPYIESTPDIERFRAMNTDVEVAGASAPMEPWFRRVEGLLSRFDPGSTLSQLNQASATSQQGRWVIVPPLLSEAIQFALKAAEMTGGAFDPTVLDALEAAGYRQSFEKGAAPSEPTRPAGRWREIKLAPGGLAVWMPPGLRLDLGGVGKGLSVDGALAQMKSCPRILVNAGGDLALRTAPGDEPVLIDVADPFHDNGNADDQTLLTLALQTGACATSSTLGRKWGPDLHHIIDPRTGLPAKSGLVAATVVAPTAAMADVLAKSCIILGREAALALLNKEGCHGILVAEDGTVTKTVGLEDLIHVNA